MLSHVRQLAKCSRCLRSKATASALRSSTLATSTIGHRFMSSDSIRPALTVFSEEEQSLKDMVSQFAHTEMAPLVMEMDEKGELNKDLLNKLFENGLMGVETPEEYGGSAMSFTQACIVVEELARVDPAVSVIVDIQNTLINTIFRNHASDEQKENWLPRLATDTLGAFALSEEGSGSDAFALKTSAQLEGDSWVLNGTKMWISNSKEAGLFIVFANANPEEGYKGITAFLVPADTPGLSVGKKEDKLGIRASSTCPLILENVEIPKENVLGSVGTGYKIAIGSLNEGRIGIGAQMTGLALGAFENALPYVHQRKQFGKSLNEFQGMQFRIAEAATDIEAARLLVYNAARLKDSGHPFTQEAAMAKLYASQCAERTASQAIEWFGGLGFVRGIAEKMYRDSKIGSIYEGTSNLQLQTIAKNISREF